MYMFSANHIMLSAWSLGRCSLLTFLFQKNGGYLWIFMGLIHVAFYLQAAVKLILWVGWFTKMQLWEHICY